MYGVVPTRPVIGITGGLATGKSLVTRLLHARGAVTFSADEASRAVLTREGAVVRALLAAFGPSVLRPDGELDRVALGQRIFQDTEARARLNAITHPPILSLLRAQIESAQDDLAVQTVIAVEVPLLFETHMEPWFDAVLVVTAALPVQLARLRERNGLEETEARKRIASQWPLAEKERRATLVIRNEGTVAQVATVVDAIWAKLVELPVEVRDRR